VADLTRRQVLGLTGGLAAGAATLGSGWRAVAAGLERRKNIVLVIVDSLRADHLGCYGNDRVRTPCIDALAAEGTCFTRAFPSAMPTLPARRSIMTGRPIFPFVGWEPWDGLGHTPGWAPIMPGQPTLATELRRRGYWTGYVTDNPFLAYAPPLESFRRSFHEFLTLSGQGRVSVPAGALAAVSEEQARATLPEAFQDRRHVDAMRRHMAANGVSGDTIDESQVATARVFNTGRRLLRSALSRRPFLLVVDSFDPHEPWVVPQRYLDLYRSPDDVAPALGDTEYLPPSELSPRDLERMRATYAASVTMVDHWLDRLLDALRALRLADSTVIMLVSDHGFLLGEHDWVGKSAWHLHPELIRVPLIVRDPDGRGRGTTSRRFASTHDVAPTLLSLAGVRRSTAFEGLDLTPAMGGEPACDYRPLAFGGYSNHFFARDDRWALISHNHGAGQKLFDLEADPGEERNVAAQHPDVVERMYSSVVASIGRAPPVYTHAEIDAPPRNARGA
jgi:arylsulfatase A-like enzyme